MRTLLIYILCLTFGSFTQAEEKRRVVTVSAQSEFRVAPDEAIIAFSVSTKNDKLLAAKVENDSLTTAIVKAVKAQSITAEEFKVTDLDMGPRYERSSQILLDYSVTRSFEIRTKDFAKIDRIIGGIVDAGGDSISISQLKLQVRDQRKHQVEARRLAVEFAREKATHLAELNQMKLGNAITITEEVEYNNDAGGFGGFGGGLSAVDPSPDSHIATVPKSSTPKTRSLVSLVSLQKAPAAPEAKLKEVQAANQDVLLSPGQISLNATVKIEFELLPKE